MTAGNTTSIKVTLPSEKEIVLTREFNAPRSLVFEAFVKLIPKAELELMPEAGHAVWMDDADHVAKAVSAFLTRPDGPQ